ncbi:DUF4387 domain-containing protein [Glaciecola siphonariae]|uniref:DUF4387 domain-containing protein n=1 Tax=Glaciecola siphonariae TaxID=521012 RepID=A0ABV9LTP3_9ALTE
MHKPLHKTARIIRSKNAGPFAITFDVFFNDIYCFNEAKRSEALTREAICQLYAVALDDLTQYVWVEAALGFKFTFRRHWPQGSVNERDTFGAQQHSRLYEVNI